MPALDAQKSMAAVGQLNTNRSALAGINRRPLPSGTVTPLPRGNVIVHAVNGRQYGVRANGTLESYSAPGHRATFSPSGRVQTLHTATLDVAHGAHGGRTVVMLRPNSTRVVSFGRGGYVEQPLIRGGRSLVQRTWVVQNRTFTRVYSTYTYRGLQLTHYQPSVSYAPAYYGWVYYPWAVPVAYTWGWTTTPWYRGDSTYFSVSPTYPSASAWLGDYVLGTTLQTAQEVQQVNPGASIIGDTDSDNISTASEATPITPELKQALANVVQQQVSSENAAAQDPGSAPELSGLQRALQANHLFVVDRPLSVITADDRTCPLSAGDMLRLSEAPAADAINVTLIVAASRQGECPGNAEVAVSFEDLQEMHNSFRTQLAAGLQTLHDRQGQAGLPAAPPSAIEPPPRPTDTATPASDARTLVQLAQKEADSSEQTLEQTAFNN